MSESTRRRHRHVAPWLLYTGLGVSCTLFVLLIGLFAWGQVHSDRQHSQEIAGQRAVSAGQKAIITELRSDVACVKNWADAYTARAKFIDAYLRPRTNAGIALEEAQANDAPAARVKALQTVLANANRAYAAALTANPPPPGPTFLCGLHASRPPGSAPTTPAPRSSFRPSGAPAHGSGAGAPPVVPSSSARPRSTSSSRTAPTTSPRPSATTTRVVIRPGPTVTRTAIPTRSSSPSGILAPVCTVLTLLC